MEQSAAGVWEPKVFAKPIFSFAVGAIWCDDGVEYLEMYNLFCFRSSPNERGQSNDNHPKMI